MKHTRSDVARSLELLLISLVSVYISVLAMTAWLNRAPLLSEQVVPVNELLSRRDPSAEIQRAAGVLHIPPTVMAEVVGRGPYASITALPRLANLYPDLFVSE